MSSWSATDSFNIAHRSTLSPYRLTALSIELKSSRYNLVMESNCRSSAALSGLLLVFLATFAGCAEPVRSGVVDLEGKVVSPLDGAGPKLLIFTRSDCPVANRFAPEISRLHDQYASRGVRFYLVYVDPAEPVASIRKHLQDYSLPNVAVRDPRHSLVKRTEVSITPEAALLDGKGTLLYRGRINDQYVAFTKSRPQPKKHDLEDALRGLLDGSLKKLVTTEAIGCYIGDLTPEGGE